MTIDRAKLSVKFILERLKENIEEGLQQQYPVGSDGPATWLALLEGLRRTAESYLVESNNPSHGDAARRKLVEEASEVAVETYTLLVEMRGADSKEIPVPTVKPLYRWLSELGHKNTTVFRADLEANYELRQLPQRIFQRLRNPSVELQDAIKATNWPVLRVTVPAKAFAIVPHLAVVAHEIGHALYSKVTPDRTPLAPHLSAAEKRIEARLTTLDTETKADFVRTLSSWLEEFTADAVMFHLTGPAGFFALAEVLQLMGGPHGFSKSHPGSVQRRRMLFSRLSMPFAGSASHADIFKKHTGQELTEDFNSSLMETPTDADAIFNMVSKFRGHTLKQAAVVAELYEAMPHAEPIIYDTVYSYLNTHAKSLIYTSAQYDADLQNHFQPLLEAIPPVETGEKLNEKEPATFPSILNVGWAGLLTRLAGLRVKTAPGSDMEVGKMDRLQGLLLKAVELSEARRDWKDA